MFASSIESWLAKLICARPVVNSSTMRAGVYVMCSFLLLQLAGAANILGLFFIPSRSHHILGEALMRGFAERGHNVTLVSSFKMKETPENFTLIHIENLVEPFDELKKNFQDQKTLAMFSIMIEFQRLLTEVPLDSEPMKRLRASGIKYDVMISDEFFNRVFYGLAYELGAQVVSFSPTHSVLVNHMTGNTAPHSFVPWMMTSFNDRMTFKERILNTISGVSWTLFRKILLEPTEHNLYRKYFKDTPELDELMKNLSLVLVNTHVSVESPRPYVPQMIPIGGYHVREAKELPQDLKAYLDAAKEGLIYCSLGSNVKISDLSKEKILAFTRSFAKFPQKVLWKWDGDEIPELSNNVITRKWLPQRDILAHPNVQVFVTHGGLLSTTEAIANGVPMIGIPFYGDQQMNVKMITSGGFGITITKDDLTEDTLTKAIKEIQENPKYRKEVQKRRDVFLDRPMNPMDTAIYWVEHIIRNGGGKHLRCTGADLTFFEYWLLDVISFISVVLFVVITLLVWSCRWCCCSRNRKKHSQKAKKE